MGCFPPAPVQQSKCERFRSVLINTVLITADLLLSEISLDLSDGRSTRAKTLHRDRDQILWAYYSAAANCFSNQKVPYLGLVVEFACVAFDDSCSGKRNERVSFNVSWTDVFQTPKNPAYQVFAQRHHPGCPSVLFILWPKVDKHDQFANGYFGIFFKTTVSAKTPHLYTVHLLWKEQR